jgi:hypothetical protein
VAPDRLIHVTIADKSPQVGELVSTLCDQKLPFNHPYERVDWNDGCVHDDCRQALEAAKTDGVKSYAFSTRGGHRHWDPPGTSPTD